MNPLIEWVASELRRLLVDRVVNELLGELSTRDIQMILFGVILTLLIMELG